MDKKPKTFIITKSIDYKEQRNKFISFLQEKEKTVKIENFVKTGLEIYDMIVESMSYPSETFMRYSNFHHHLTVIQDKLKLKMRLYVMDDGNNALFVLKSIHDDFALKFYVEFKSIYGDVEQMRLAKIARKIAGIEK